MNKQELTHSHSQKNINNNKERKKEWPTNAIHAREPDAIKNTSLEDDLSDFIQLLMLTMEIYLDNRLHFYTSAYIQFSKNRSYAPKVLKTLHKVRW